MLVTPMMESHMGNDMEIGGSCREIDLKSQTRREDKP